MRARLRRIYDGNNVELLRNGTEFFPALLAAIDNARDVIYLQTYIFELDRTGVAVAEALERAAGRGVVVQLMLDGYGAHKFPRIWRERLADAGVRLLFFRPNVSPLTLKRHRLRRMHRKVSMVDARVAFVGGINIIDDCNTPHQTPPRYDYAVKIEGPLIMPIFASLRHDWWQSCMAQFRQSWIVQPRLLVAATSIGAMQASFVIRDNVSHRKAIENTYLAAIRAARTEIVIASAYFLPGVTFRRALVDAAGRGVRVVVLLQGRVEYWLMHHATRALHRHLIESGVELYEYTASFMHAKVAVIDGEWATVGSSNIDPFSLLLAREANVVVRDTGFAADLRASLDTEMRLRSSPVSLREVRQRGMTARFFSWMAYGVVRLLMSITGYGQKEYQGRDD